MQKKKLLFIGGHHNSAIATIDWLQQNDLEDQLEFFWIGKKYINRTTLTPEYSEVSERNIPFYNIVAGKLYRAASVLYLPLVMYNLLLVPIGFLQALYYVFRIRPDLIISFGGYMAVPVVISGFLLKIKSILHEQTACIGLANKISANFVEKICTSWPENFYSEESPKIKRKLVYTGLPISKEKIEKVTNLDNKYEFSREGKTIYITGGKSGSLFINKIILDVLDTLSEKYNLIWSTGRRVGEADYNTIMSAVQNLPQSRQENIIVKEYFGEQDMLKVLSTADIVISRGGGHTMYELALIKKPAIVIPIPWSSNQEQLKNAKILEEFGLAVVLDQEKLTPYVLIETVENFAREVDTIVEKVYDTEFVSPKGQENLGNEIYKTIGAQKSSI